MLRSENDGAMFANWLVLSSICKSKVKHHGSSQPHFRQIKQRARDLKEDIKWQWPETKQPIMMRSNQMRK
jgi:hypothetical protein